MVSEECCGIVLELSCLGCCQRNCFFVVRYMAMGRAISLSRILKLISSVSQVHGLSESFCHHDFVGQSDS